MSPSLLEHQGQDAFIGYYDGLLLNQLYLKINFGADPNQRAYHALSAYSIPAFQAHPVHSWE